MKDVEYKGKIIRIEQDVYYDESNPRYWDQLSFLLCSSNTRLNIGDETMSNVDITEYIKNNKDKIAFCFPIYVLDHSSIALSLIDFYDKWDSYMIGYAIVFKERMQNIFDKEITEEEAIKEVENELKEYECFLNGEVYSVSLIEKRECPFCHNVSEEVIDNIGGYYTMNLIKGIRDVVDNDITDEEAEKIIKEAFE